MTSIIKKYFKVIVLCIIALFFIGILVFNTIFNSAKDIVNDYAKGMQLFDSKLIVDLYMDEMILESYDSKDEMIKEFDRFFKEKQESFFKILKYDIDNNFKIYEGKEYDYRKKSLVEYYGIQEKYIKEIREYTITFYCSDKDVNREVKSKLIIANIKRKWYLVSTE